jgi:hypothetical protein
MADATVTRETISQAENYKERDRKREREREREGEREREREREEHKSKLRVYCMGERRGQRGLSHECLEH